MRIVIPAVQFAVGTEWYCNVLMYCGIGAGLLEPSHVNCKQPLLPPTRTVVGADRHMLDWNEGCLLGLSHDEGFTHN